MIHFNDNIKPNNFSYNKKGNLITEFENGEIRVRNIVKPFNEVSVSFLLNDEELDYFEDFFNNGINKGLDEFTATWDKSIQKYSFLSGISYSFNETKELHNISFVVSNIRQFCSRNNKAIKREVKDEIENLQLRDSHYYNRNRCSDELIMLNFNINKELEDLRLLDNELMQYSSVLLYIDSLSEADCTDNKDLIFEAIDLEFSALTYKKPDPISGLFCSSAMKDAIDSHNIDNHKAIYINTSYTIPDVDSDTLDAVSSFDISITLHKEVLSVS